jgi:Acetyltransferase (isoleucine patch superfamily)
VKIADQAIIGMNSMVTKDIEARAIVAGNPAKLIRYRD